ncbi:MAG TPA: hypothetical protein PKA41_01815 [Verrucomicrobiota bacterium]|nr:hypothetical protein [Verrucomicrobiota bacterium]
MGLIDSILNFAALLLWLGWRSARVDPIAGATAATLAGTLRRVDKPRLRGWQTPAVLAGLILLRSFFYWQIGSAVNWTGNLDLLVISIPFRMDRFSLALLFSVSSFLLTLVVFWLCALFVSIVSGREAGFDGVRRFTRLHLGFVEGWPAWLKLLLPLLAVVPGWWLMNWLLAYQGLLPQPVSPMHRVEQSVVIGIGSYLAWKYVIVGTLVLHLVASYVYLGNHPFWGQVNALARRLLKPLSPVPLSVGRVDFAPAIGILIVFAAARLVGDWLTRLYMQLPL